MKKKQPKIIQVFTDTVRGYEHLGKTIFGLGDDSKLYFYKKNKWVRL